ncbi:saccharopine dehydrogenase NADP-binding domain-containing protein [Paenisporosarcina quisquiliarum]|uniref:Saccharopine dehydrogenase NADP-binding domain-containing protein n=1 Tax=Paenisporosarcina quisquiliarum TaxID=365346 RepID=A0A9X3LI75_9BACL|nr:saccharopine dehydrogenase NADP-binding domain-containing protein [Paenisporosarcina quisquiliarum]MCZ8537850.1 saccharopine dehydrogenase NADP-binding domain-containing protein [Paenisporosarcina quisquiliarum]
MNGTWMIYGANGYTGELIARTAVEQGLKPILGGRNKEKIHALARELGLESRLFSLNESANVQEGLAGVDLVLHCAGPFSQTSAPMIEACIKAGVHYLDITGEIGVFEHAHAPAQSNRAQEAGVVICSGVGFDVVPTDCIALKLKELLPNATHLSLGFDSDSGISPGTFKTMLQGLSSGSAERKNGIITEFPLGTKHRFIDFGKGSRSAMAIPWGDVSTAFYTTGIPNINTWIPMPTYKIVGARSMKWLKPILAKPMLQKALRTWVDKSITGPDEEARKNSPAYIWGEATTATGEKRTVRIQTANVYSLTVYGALAITTRLLETDLPGGSYTPATLFGSELIEQLPGSGTFQIE